MFQAKVVKKIKTHFLCSVSFYRKLCLNEVEPDRPQMKILCMCIACWIPKATNTHSEYLILLAFLLEQWWHKRFSMLCYITLPLLLLYVCSEDM